MTTSPVTSTSADRILDRLLAVEDARPTLDRAAAEAAVRRSLDLGETGPVEFRWVDDFEQAFDDEQLVRAAWAAWDAWDAWAARDARDAWDARDARAARDAWDARDARDARDA